VRFGLFFAPALAAGIACASCSGTRAAHSFDGGSRLSAPAIPEGGTDDAGATEQAGYPASDPGVYQVIADASTCPADGGSAFVAPTIASDASVSLLPAGAGGISVPCVCVTVDLSAYDRSCQTAQDCIPIGAGVLCSNQCIASCGNAYVNSGELGRYRKAIGPLVAQQSTVGCNCPNIPVPACVQGRCVVQVGGEGGAPVGPPQ